MFELFQGRKVMACFVESGRQYVSETWYRMGGKTNENATMTVMLFIRQVWRRVKLLILEERGWCSPL